MRRVYFACLCTALSIAALIGVKARQTVPASDQSADMGDVTGGAPPGGALGGGALGGALGPTAGPSGQQGPAGTPGPSGKPTSGGSPTPSGNPTTTKPPSSPPPPTATSRTVSGFTCSTRYGTVRVAVTVTGTHIDDVTYSDHTSEPRSSPSKLKTQVLNSQSANNLTAISGATYTSAAFIASVQNALYGSPLNKSISPFVNHVTSCA